MGFVPCGQGTFLSLELPFPSGSDDGARFQAWALPALFPRFWGRPGHPQFAGRGGALWTLPPEPAPSSELAVPERAWAAGLGSQLGSARPVLVGSNPVWRDSVLPQAGPAAPAGPQGRGLCRSELLCPQQPHGVKLSRPPPVAAPRPLGGGGLRATAGLGGRGHGRLCYGTSQGECLLLVTCVPPSVLPRPGAGGAGGRPQSHGPGSVSVPKSPVLL